MVTKSQITTQHKHPKRRFEVKLPDNASMGEMIDGLWYLPRDIISDGYDAALEALTTQLPMTIHEYESGTECWTWIVPEKWNCHDAYLEAPKGTRLFSYTDHPLHVMSYSLPFEGKVSLAELLEHLHVHPKLPEAIPFACKYYERDWGLCCSQVQRDELVEGYYRVVIDSEFSPGTLKVGETVVHGQSEECIVLCTHLCHPATVNDGLTGVVVGVEVMRQLQQRRDLRYTYRLLILPETIGSIAYLSHNEHIIPQMQGGLFLEMLGLDNPAALQMSYHADTQVDRCFLSAFKEKGAGGWTGAFRTVIGNDERQFNSPGVRVPMMSLSRVFRRESPHWPYPEYHSNLDNPELVSQKKMRESVDLVMTMIDAWESNRIPVNRFKGEIFMSRYGLNVDFYRNPAGHKVLFDIMYEVDGSKTVADIAQKLGLRFSAVMKVLQTFQRHELIEYN